MLELSLFSYCASKFRSKEGLYIIILFGIGGLLWFYTLSSSDRLNLTIQFKYPESKESSLDLKMTPTVTSEKSTRATIVTKESTTASIKQKTILVWYLPFQDASMLLGYLINDRHLVDLRDDWAKSGYEINTPFCGNCRITHNRNELNESNAVVFHSRDINPNDVPSPSTRLLQIERRKIGNISAGLLKNKGCILETTLSSLTFCWSSYRTESQLYVWWSQESVTNSGTGGKVMKDFFNATMSVRRSSDIYSPYLTFRVLLHLIWKKQNGIDLISIYNQQTKGKALSIKELQSVIANLPRHSMATIFTEIPPHISNENAELIKKKNRKVAWIVSNCDYTIGANLRHNYYKKLLSADLAVDVYGRCGTWPYPIKSRGDPAFYEILSRYKFYLSMENSFYCQDYITEKLWFNALYSGTVPVILGPHRDDIAAILPPKSYIHVEDFSSHQELVDYLRYLDQNVTAYAEFLEWRNLAKFFDKEKLSEAENNSNTSNETELNLWNKYAKPIASGFCGLCNKLHSSQNQTNHVIRSIDDVLKNDRKECLTPQLARKIIDHKTK